MISRRVFLGGATAALAVLTVFTAPSAWAGDKYITVASTTSTENSGLFDHILPAFKAATGIDVRVVAQGTGQAIKTAMAGDADVIFVHDRSREDKFVTEGYGVKRFPVMYNDFVLVGPKADPAKVGEVKTTAEALARIAAAKAGFASRGDKSGTHAAELRFWQSAGVDPAGASGTWYKETGSGMGATLNTAAAANAYALTDRATWLNFKNRGDLAVLVQGDPKMFNQYGVMLVNPAKHSHVKADLGQKFVDWLVSATGQKAIADHKIGGEQLFFPNANEAGV